jgi:hypothetical protein
LRETKRLRRSPSAGDQHQNDGRRSVSAERNATERPRSPKSSDSISKRYNDAVAGPGAGSAQKKALCIIDLGDSDDDEGLSTKPDSLDRDVNMGMNQGQALQEAVRPEDDPDEEFPELVAKARERARLQEQQQLRQASHRNGQELESQIRATTEEHDPVINILIHPLIPNTAPLLVKRKYRQNFKDVRLAWCAKNNIAEEARLDVFFTWRERRIFDVASCRSIGIKLDSDGRPFMKRPEDGYTEPIDQIVLNATTQEIQEQMKKLAEAATKERDQQSRSLSPERIAPQYKVIMRSKGHPDQKLLVREVCLAQPPPTIFADNLYSRQQT